MRRLVESEDVQENRSFRYGRKFEIRGILNGPKEICRGGLGMDHSQRGKRSAFCHSVSGRKTMRFKMLDTVVLEKDLPDYDLCRGDLGAVVEVYEPDGVEVEFITASGKTQALVTLNEHDIRPVGDYDLVTVRSLQQVT